MIELTIALVGIGINLLINLFHTVKTSKCNIKSPCLSCTSETEFKEEDEQDKK